MVQREEVEWKRKRGKIFGDGEIFGPQRGKRTMKTDVQIIICRPVEQDKYLEHTRKS